MSCDIMEKYEKTIGLKTIWLTIIRRYLAIFLVFIPIAAATVIYTQLVMKKSYQSSTTFINNTNLNQTQHSQIALQITKTETINATVERLAAKEAPIIVDASTITSGLSVTAFNSNNPGIVTFSFTSTNKDIAKPILTELEEVALDAVKASGFANMGYKSRASEPIKVSKDKTYLLIGLAAGAVLALGFAFVYEIISDEVYDKDDIEKLGCSGFEFTVSK